MTESAAEGDSGASMDAALHSPARAVLLREAKFLQDRCDMGRGLHIKDILPGPPLVRKECICADDSGARLCRDAVAMFDKAAEEFRHSPRDDAANGAFYEAKKWLERLAIWQQERAGKP